MASVALISGSTPSTRASTKWVEERRKPAPQSSSTWGNEVVVWLPLAPS